MNPRFISPVVSLLLGLGTVRSETPRAVSPIAQSMRQFVDNGTVAGAVTLVADADKVLALDAVGHADIKAGRAMDERSLFWIASMTKPITSTAIMMLADEGKLSIDDPVEKHLPEFKGQMLIAEKSPERVVLQKPKRVITIKDLLTHTSGLTSSLPTGGPSLDTLTLRGAAVGYAISPLQSEPGTKWQYCNPGINTLGRIIEVVSGMSYAQFLQTRIFGPLGMNETTFWPDEKQLQRLAVSYKFGADKKTLEPTTVAYLTWPYSDRSRMALPAGGLFSTAGDLVKFYQMILNGGTVNGKRLIKEETVKLMTSKQTGDIKAGFTEGAAWGLGWGLVDKPQGVTAMLSAGAFGHGGAYGTQAWIDPVKKRIYVLLIQRADIGNSDGSALRGAFQQAAVDAFGK